MIGYVLFVWAWLYAATAIEAQAVQLMARTAPPPPRSCKCNYIIKEGEFSIGDGSGEACKDS